MQGRTRGAFEDIFVLVILVLLCWGGYVFFFTEDKIVIPSSANQTVKSNSMGLNKEDSKIEPTKVIKNENIVIPNDSIQKNKDISIKDTVSKTTNLKKELQQPLDKQVEVLDEELNEKQGLKELEAKKVQKELKKIDEVSTKSVDLKLLQKFLIGTKQKIKNSILLDDELKSEVQMLSIRITVLKSGNFEQLIFTGGNIEIFKKNYQNITQVFPVEIEESIVGDFPRYLRYRFKFSKKEE